MSAWLAKVRSHNGTVEAFHDKAETKATPFASVGWIQRFSQITIKETEHLVTHAIILLGVQASLLNLAYIGTVCQGPSYGGSYMDEGTSHIRIGLLLIVVSGNHLATVSCFLL